MSGLEIKKKIAKILDILKINDLMLLFLNSKYKNNYIRIINYHETSKENIINFEKQIKWYSVNFENCDYKTFELFLNREYTFKNRPGLMITFDDGYVGNYHNATKILNKYGYSGYYFVSTGLIGQKEYMNISHLSNLIQQKHIIGCHTYTHHRMNINDADDLLFNEITQSKMDLEKKLNVPINIFCWVGGEEETYTKKAFDLVKKSEYKYSMMTISEPVIYNSDKYKLNRTNIEDNWDISLVKFQISGFIDSWFRKKRKYVNKILDN
jgi:peptidoglycan/xylan/chitin deacetylase (PgdA/CDA1 family)